MSDPRDETSIRNIIEAGSRAIRDGDAEAMSANVSDEVVIFDVVRPLSSDVGTAARDRAEQWLAGYDGAVRWETADVRVAASGDVAFSHNLIPSPCELDSF